MPKVTYRQVRRLLTDLGFQERPTKGSHFLYVHPTATSVRVVVPRDRDRDPVTPSVWLGIRRMLYETGIMAPEEAEDRVSALAS